MTLVTKVTFSIMILIILKFWFQGMLNLILLNFFFPLMKPYIHLLRMRCLLACLIQLHLLMRTCTTTSPPPSPLSEMVPIRRGSGIRVPHVWMNDYTSVVHTFSVKSQYTASTTYISLLCFPSSFLQHTLSSCSIFLLFKNQHLIKKLVLTKTGFKL